MSEKKGSGDGVGADEGQGRSARVDRTGPFIDDVFAVLSDWRRREICRFFADADIDTASVDDLAMLVAGCRPDAVAGRERPTHDGLVAALDETHLPHLDDAGVIDYDSRSGTVRYRGQPTVEKWLEHVAAVDRRSS